MVSHIDFNSAGKQPLNKVTYTPGTKDFLCTAGLSEEYSCQVAYGFGDSADPLKDVLIELFTHPSHAESDIRPIKLSPGSDDTIGWLCTIGSLTSSQHAYVDNPHFRRAAFVAFFSLLQNRPYTKELGVNNEATVQISDLFDDELSILILHKPSVANSVSDSFVEILPSLHQYGFIPHSMYASMPFELGKVAADMFLNSGKNLCLKLLSKDVGFSDFTSQVFRQLLPSAPTPLLRFFVYYQLIETLLARIFSDRQSDTIMKLVEVKDNPFKVHPLIEKLKDDAKESKRMRLLFDEYSGTSAAMRDLLVACNDFLVANGAEEKELAAEALYGVRNIIFHDLRGIQDKAMPLLQDVTEQLGFAVTMLLVSFRTSQA